MEVKINRGEDEREPLIVFGGTGFWVEDTVRKKTSYVCLRSDDIYAESGLFLNLKAAAETYPDGAVYEGDEVTITFTA